MSKPVVTKDSEKTYHSVQAVSNSALTQFNKSPAHYLEFMNRTGKPEEKTTDALLLGSLYHMFMLQPDLVRKTYAKKQFSGTTKEGRAEKEKAFACGITLVRGDIWETVKAMAEETYRSPFWVKATQGQRKDEFFTETSLYWADEDFGDIRCKARIDCYTNIPGFGPVIIDLKTTTDSSPAAIQNTMAKAGYHRQAAWYSRAMKLAGFEVKSFIFLFIEKTPPYPITLGIVSEEALNTAYGEIRSLMDRLKACIECGTFPAYSIEPIELNLPSWYTAQKELEIALTENGY